MKLRLPHKFQAALMAALASVSITTLSSGTAQAAMQDAVWDFEGSIEAQTGITGLGYEFRGGTATYVDSNIFIGRDLTSTQVSLANLGQAIDISSSQYIRVTDKGYWSTGDGALKLGSNATNDFTISVWTKLDAISGERFIMGTSDGDNKGFSFAMESGGKLDFLAKSVAHHDVSSTTAPTNEWVNLTITYDAATGVSTGYINGDSIGSITLNNAGFKDGGGNLGIGTGSADKKQASFDGQIASLSILSGAMTAEQVKAQAAVAADTLGTYTWSATAEGSDWADAVWTKDSESGQYFQNIGNAVFGANAAVTTVGVRSTTHAHDVTLGGTYTFNLADGVELTMNKLTLENAASAAFNSTGSAALQIGTVAGPGTVTAGQGVDIRAYNINAGSGTVTIAGAGSVTTTEGASGNVAVSSGATWKLGGSGNWTYSGVLSGAGNIEKIGAGTLTLGGNNSFTGPVLVKEGTLKLDNGNALGAANNSITIEEGATVDVNGKDNRIYYYTLHGGSLVNNGGNTDFNHTQNARITLTADSTVGGSGKLWMIAGSWGDTTANLNNHTLTKEGTGTFSFVNTDISAGTIMVNQGTVEFYNRGGNGSNNSNVQADIVLNGGTISGAYNYTASETAVSRALTANQDVTVTAAIELGANVTLATNVATGKTLTMSGAITGAGTIAKEGAGALTFTGSLVVNGTILLDGGSLALNGAVTFNTNNIAAFEVFDSTGQTYSYEAKGSGFLSNPGQYYLVKGTGSATASHGTSITGGSYVDSPSAGAGDIIVTFTPAGTTYYVNQDMSTTEDNSTMLGSSVKDISIKKGVTLTASASGDTFNGPAKLHGEGKYALASQATGLNSGLTLGADWTGSVVLSGPAGTRVTNINLQNSAVGAAGAVATSNSSIELRGIEGYLKYSGTANLNNANLIMTNPTDRPGVSALKLTDGSSTSVTYLTGSISGSGDFEHAWDKSTVKFELQGDLSQWTGNIIKSKGGITEFTLSNNPGGTIAVGAKGNSGTLNIYVTNSSPVTMSGNFAKGGGTLNVNVKDTTQATFTGSITNANLTVNAGASATMATDATITGISNSGTVAVTGGHTVKLITSANANLGSVVLSSGDSTTPSTIGMRGDGAARTYTFNKLAVSGQGHVSVVSSNTGGQGFHAQVNITSLTNADDSPATIYLGNSAHANASIYNINGGSFTGEIVLRGESDSGTRLTGYQFNDANVAANSVLTFDKAALGGINKLGLGLGADITVQGIRHAAGMTESTTIYSGAYTFGQNSDFVSYGTDVHTITIAGAGEYATSATVKNHVNLAMDGAGTQTFSGDMSAFNGTITVKDGTLALDSAVANAGAVAVNGGSLVLGNSLTTTSAMTVANGATLKFAGTDKLTVGGNLTLGGYLDVSNIACEIGTTVNLASYSGTLDYSGATLTGLAAGVQATLGASDGHLTLTFAEPPMPEFGNDLGKVMYVGDSITDGVESQHSWRYSFFKILADEGIGQAEEGYFQNVHTNRQNAPFTDSYGNHTFANTHSAQASVRSYETAATKTGTDRLGYSSIQNWLGQSDTMRNGGTYTGPVYSGDAAPDTFFMLLGTNDLLSEGGNHVTQAHYEGVIKAMFDYYGDEFHGSEGTFDVILGSMLQANPEAKLVILEMPTWNPSRGGNHDNPEDYEYMARFNQTLADWAATKSDANITIVNPNVGITDVANTTKPGAGVARMFIKDGLHPSNQGELLIAGNVAKALGYGGRTMGQARMGANGSAFKNLNLTPAQGSTVAKTWAEAGLDVTGSYTVDISSLLVGDGYGDSTWNTGELLSITVGNGSQQGVLKVNEAYIQWNNDILYSMDMSQNAEALRITYITGSDLPSGYRDGYFVWLGDMMIGESLASSAGSTNGVSISWSSSSQVTMGTVKAAAGAYAPALAPGHYENAEGLYLVGNSTAIIPWTQPTDESIGHSGLNQTASGNYVAGAHVSATGAPGTGTYTTVTGGSNVSTLYANQNNHTGDVYMLVNGVSMKNNNGAYGWIAAQNSNTLTGDASVKVENSGNSKAMLFGTVSGNISGDVYTEVNGGTFASYTTSGSRASYAGSYQGNITGLATLLTTGGVFEDSVFGGVHNGNGNSIGSTLLDLRGGLFKGNVYGGGAAGTVNSGASVVVSGDAVVNGNVYGGGTGGTVNGGASVTLAGGLVRGNVYGGGAGGTINGATSVIVDQGAAVQGNIYGNTDTVQGGTVTIQNRTAGFDHTGSILTGTLDIQDTQGTVTSKATAATVNAAGTTAATLTDLTLKSTAAVETVSLHVEDGASLSLAGKLSLPGTASYTGVLTLDDGLVISMVGSGDEGAYSDGENGYRLAGETTILQRGDDGSSLVVNGELVGAGILAGAMFTYDDATGTLSSSVQAENETYCVNTGSVTYGASQSETKSITEATTVLLQSATSATLTLAQNLTTATTGGIVVAASTQNAVIGINKFEADGTTPIVLKETDLHAEGAVTLTGAGVFYLSDNSSTMPAALASGASGWTGTVRLCTTTANTKINEETLVNGTYSTLEMNGFNGWFDNNHWYGQRNLNIKFTDLVVGNATTYAWSCGAYVSEGRTEQELELSGTLSGDGTFNRFGANIMHYAYSGNISDWTGKFLMTGGGRTNLTFKGNATDVKVAIEQQGNGTLNVNVRNEATFSNDIKGVSSFTVAESQAATLQGQDKDRQLGNVTLEDNASLDVMSIADAAKLSVGDVTLGTGAVMGVYKGETVQIGTNSEGKLTIQTDKVLTAGEGATLNANLEMASGSHLDVSAAQSGDVKGLLMGSEVTLNSNSYLDIEGYSQDQVSGYLYDYLTTDGHDLYYLFQGTENDPLSLKIDGTQVEKLTFTDWQHFDKDASEVYQNLQAQTFYMVYNGSNVGMVAIGLLPEPTTSTLSLLALCALAARRRRK